MTSRFSAEHIVVWIVLGFTLLLYLFFLNNSPAASGDQTYYITLGGSLAAGQGFREIWTPRQSPHVLYPFMYPVILSIPIRFFGYNYCIMRLVNLLFLLGSVAMLYFLLRPRAEKLIVWSVLALTAVSCGIFFYVFRVLTEIPYLFFSLLGLIALRRYIDGTAVLSRRLIFSVVVVACAYFIKVNGAALVLAAAVFLIAEKGRGHSSRNALWKAAAFVTALALIMGAGGLRNIIALQHGGSTDYLYHAGLFIRSFDTHGPLFFLRLLAQNLYSFAFYSIPYVVSGVVFGSRNWLAFLLTALLAVGFAVSYIKKRGIIDYYFLAYIVLLFIVPYTSYCRRYFVPLTPFIYYYFLEGLFAAGAPLRRLVAARFDIMKIIAGMCVIYSLAMIGAYVSDSAHYKELSAAQVNDVVATARWIDSRIPRDKVFLSFTPPHVYLYFKRQCLQLPYVIEKALYRFSGDSPRPEADYIIVSDTYLESESEMLLKDFYNVIPTVPGVVEIYRCNTFTIYEIMKNQAPPAPAGR